MLTKNENIKILFLIALAFSFSVLVRFYWPMAFSNVEEYKYNNEFILTTNDAFFFAEGARDIVNNPEFINERSPVNKPISILAASISKILPFSLETILVYLPIFFSSLLVIPIILIGKKLNNLNLGFLAAIIASTANSYYNRTMAGYFDTDFLNIVFPMFLIWSLYSAIETKENKFIIFTAVEIILYRAWYPQSYALEFAFLGIVFLITIFEFFRHKDYKYNLTLISFMLLAMMMLDSIYRIIIVTILILFMYIKKDIFYRYLKYIFIFAVLMFIVTGGLNPIIGKLEAYLIRDIIVFEENLRLHFPAVMGTISETKKISFETMGIRSIGNYYVFIISLIGTILLIYKNRTLILLLPMLGLGFLSLIAGLRFTIYAGPVVALGVAYLIITVTDFLANKFSGNIKAFIKSYLLIILASFVLIPNLNHIKSFDAFPTIDKQTVETLANVKEKSHIEDYMIGWWSYGYLIRYYTNTNTLIDGGKHSGSDNFLSSSILTSKSQIEAYNLSKLAINYDLKRKNNKLDDENYSERRSDIELMTLDYGFNDTNKFLSEIGKLKIKSPDENIYLFLPAKTLVSFNKILKFSNIDLMTGKEKDNLVYYSSKRHIKDEDKIVLDSKVIINLKENYVKIDDNELKINKFITSKYDKNNLINDIKQIDPNGKINVFYINKFNIYLVVDEELMNSLFVQLFLFENYDKDLFEPVELTPMSKIYKIKK